MFGKRITIFIFVWCVTSSVFGQINYNVEIFDFATPRDPKTLPMPLPSELVSTSIIEQALGLQAGSVIVRSPKDAGTLQVRNTFFKWDDSANPNAGIFMQLMTNPVYNDFAEYNSIIVDSKLTKGEEAPGLTKATPFKPLQIGKLKVAYSVENARMYWNIGNNYIVMIAFNILGFDDAKMVSFAQSIVPELNKNLMARMLE